MSTDKDLMKMDSEFTIQENGDKNADQIIEKHFSTIAVQEGHQFDTVHGAIKTPIYFTSTYKHREPGVLYSKYQYSSFLNPTVDALNNCIAALEGAKHAYTYASGLGAALNLFMILKAGDHVITTNNLYAGTNALLTRVMAKFGLEVTLIDLTPENLENHIKENTKMILIETPTNPTLTILDIEGLCKVAKKHSIISVVDNTFATPYLQSPLLLGADVSLSSCTKYMSGHSDLLAGAIATNSLSVYEGLKYNVMYLGACISPFDAYILLRSIKTLKVRMDEHCKNAQIIANFLNKHPKVSKVYYPGLESHEGHELAKKQMKGFGGMLSFVLDGDFDAVKRFTSNLKIFILAESLGTVESLIQVPSLMTHARMPKKEREELGITDSFIRMSVGIENVDDLLLDLRYALEKM